MMNDRHISATVAVSAVLWTIGCGLMVAGMFDLRFMGWGLWATAVAATFSIRKMMCQQDDAVRNAFELGRDYGRSSASVRSIR